MVAQVNTVDDVVQAMQLAEIHQKDSVSTHPVVRGDSTGVGGSSLSSTSSGPPQEFEQQSGSSHVDLAIEAGLAESTSRQAGQTRSLLARSQRRGRRMKVQLIISVVIAVLAVISLLIVLLGRRFDDESGFRYGPDQQLIKGPTTLVSMSDL